jgi:hypothetical protein
LLKNARHQDDGAGSPTELGKWKIRIVEAPIKYNAGISAGDKIRWTNGVKALAALIKYRF